MDINNINNINGLQAAILKSPNTRCCCILPWNYILLSWSRTFTIRLVLRLWILLSHSLAFVFWIEFFDNWFLEVCKNIYLFYVFNLYLVCINSICVDIVMIFVKNKNKKSSNVAKNSTCFCFLWHFANNFFFFILNICVRQKTIIFFELLSY